MNIFILKLILAPIILGGASLAGRKWGHAVSGWLIGLPLTSGPVMFILALSHGTDFVNNSILGTLSGGYALVVYSLSYGWLATRFDWPVALAGSMCAYLAIVALMQNVLVSFPVLMISVWLAMLIGLRLMPAQQPLSASDQPPGRWDLPARILIGTGFVVVLTGSAALIGARLTGLLATIPLYTSILTVFAQRAHGSAGALSVLRGLLLGMFGFVSFFTALALLLRSIDIGWAFLAATSVALLAQGISFQLVRLKE